MMSGTCMGVSVLLRPDACGETMPGDPVGESPASLLSRAENRPGDRLGRAPSRLDAQRRRARERECCGRSEPTKNMEPHQESHLFDQPGGGLPTQNRAHIWSDR